MHFFFYYILSNQQSTKKMQIVMKEESDWTHYIPIWFLDAIYVSDEDPILRKMGSRSEQLREKRNRFKASFYRFLRILVPSLSSIPYFINSMFLVGFQFLGHYTMRKILYRTPTTTTTTQEVSTTEEESTI